MQSKYNYAPKSVPLEIPPQFLPLIDPDHAFFGADFMAWYGGRSSTKSWSIARALVMLSLQRPMKILCAREYQNSIKDSVLAVLHGQIRLLGVSDYFDVQKTTIFGYNGTEFIFNGLKRNIDSIRSQEGIDLAWLEEAQTVSQESLDVLFPTVRKEGSQIIASFNPQLESDPIYQLTAVNPPPGAYICNINYTDNPWLSERSKRNIAYDKKHNYERYLHVWEGHTIERSEKKVFKKWRIDGGIEPAVDEVLYYGADWGFSNDPTVLLRCWVDDDKKEIYIDYAISEIGLEIVDTPDFFDKVPGSRKWKITGDSSRPETISHIKKQGFNIESAKKGPKSVEGGVAWLQSYTIVVHDRAQIAIDELGLYSYKVNSKTDEVLPLLDDKNNHSIDALRYALEKLIFRKVQVHV